MVSDVNLHPYSAAGVEVPGLAVFRVVRLVRVFRLFKMSKGSISLFIDTMKESVKPLYMLLMLTSIAVVVCSSLMYFIERGKAVQVDDDIWLTG